jgi:hypothetical protein
MVMMMSNEPMEKEIEEQLIQVMDATPGATTYIPAETYIKHIRYLLAELESANKRSDSWELNYYRALDKERK